MMISESDIRPDSRYRADGDAAAKEPTTATVVCPGCDRSDAPDPAETPDWYCPDCGTRREVQR